MTVDCVEGAGVEIVVVDEVTVVRVDEAVTVWVWGLMGTGGLSPVIDLGTCSITA